MQDTIAHRTIEYAKQRCHALSAEIENLEDKTYPSASPRMFLSFIKRANEVIKDYLDTIESNPDLLDPLTADELELTVKRYCKLLPYLCYLLEYIEGSEVHSTPAALIRPLRRLLRRYLPKSDILFRCYPQLNYSFLPLARQLREVFKTDVFQPCLQTLPDFFAVISFPKVESKNALLHCMVGHEIGHGLYQHKKLQDKLLPVQIDKEALEALVSRIVSTESDGNNSSGEQHPTQTEADRFLSTKEWLTASLNKVLGNWVEELAADAFGIHIFGPAYFFAFINFVATVTLLRSSRDSHPAPNIRMRLMWHLLTPKDDKTGQSIGFDRAFDKTLANFAEKWMQAASLGEPASGAIHQIAEKSITPSVVGRICSEVSNAIGESRYSVKKYEEDMPVLGDLIKNVIPPNEVVVDFEKQKTRNSDVVSILNAGWNVYLSEMQEFAKNLKLAYETNKLKCDERLNKVLLKAVELNEIKTRWDEIGND